MTSFYSSLAFIWYVHIKNSKTNGWVIPWYLPENWLKNFFLKKMVLDEWSWGDPWWSWTTWTWYHNWNMAVFGGVFLGGQSNGSNGKALLSWVTSPNLHPVDKGWASSMVITLAGLGPKQKLLSMMSWSFWRIFWPCPTSTQWTWGGPPMWLSPWRAWDQNKRCLARWADHFDIFFDRVRPPPGGHGVGLLCGYHPDRLGTKTKVA